MEQQQILNLYEWSLGICFRHPAKGEVVTAHVKTIRPPAGGIQDIRACPECVCCMERKRRVAAERDGLPYQPGRLASE